MKDKNLRRQTMGMSTLLGLRRQGFFSPYRYADQVKEPQPYRALEAVFQRSSPEMEAMLRDISAAMPELTVLNGPPPIPRWDQSWFPRLDGAAAFAMIRRHRPARIVEVGSGHSTRMLAYAAGPDVRIDCIDPQPRADIEALPLTLHRAVLGPEHFPLFDALEPGDIAFFDSSHILWPGSDVDIILNRIIPALAPGILIHIHDILLPDPYPNEWEWRGYTEQNGVAPLLLGATEALFSSHFALTRLGAVRHLVDIPQPDGALETSLWLRRK